MARQKKINKRFTGKLILGDVITVRIEYDYAKMIRHLRNRALLRNFRSLDKQAGTITFKEEEEELARRLVVQESEIKADAFIKNSETFSIVWSTKGLEQEVNRIITNRVLPNEKELFPNHFEQLAQKHMEPIFRLNMMLGVKLLLLRSLDDAVLAAIPHTPVRAAEYDKHERIPRFGVSRATRQIKKSTVPKYNSTTYIKFGEQYDRILNVVDAGKGIIGLARAVYDSNLYRSRYQTIGDAYRGEGVEVPKEVIDWILEGISSQRMPTNAAVALELAAREAIQGYSPRSLSTNTLKQYLRRSDKLRGIQRKKKANLSKNHVESSPINLV